MGRLPALSPEEKYVIVLEVLSGRRSISESAQRAGVSGQAVGNWRRQFLGGGRAALGNSASQQDEKDRLAAEVRDLRVALGVAYMLLGRRDGQWRRHPTPASSRKS